MSTLKRSWHQVRGCWSRSLGERGTRIRLIQKRKDGPFYRVVWIAGRGNSQASLGTRNRAEAERFGEALLEELRRSDHSVRAEPLTLGALWRRYQSECPTYLDNKESSRHGDAARARILIAVFGDSREVRTLTASDQADYTVRRKAGSIILPNATATVPVRTGSVWTDMVLLRAMLTWATTVRLTDGTRLLDANPLAGVHREKETNPRRPVASWERFQRTRVAMQTLRRVATRTREENPRSMIAALEESRWIKMELALVLVEATGRRLGSVRQLRWNDIDFAHHTIRWRSEFDKKGKEWIVPMSIALVSELQEFQRQLVAVTEWCFSGERCANRPMDRHLFDKWLRVAEKSADLPKLTGGLWHPYRRKWATERKHHALVDVAAAGGWSDPQTLMRCYQQPDFDAMLAVMSEPKKVREAALMATI